MSTKKYEPTAWSDELATLTARLASWQKRLGTLSPDPFIALQQLDEVRSQLKDLGIPDLAVIEGVRGKIDSECVLWEVEFWGRFMKACEEAGWALAGTTNRRLVNRAVFVSLEGRTVRVEGAANCSPFVPSVIRALSAQLNVPPITDAELKDFLSTLAKAVDSMQASGLEASLEDIFRRCVLEVQKAAFWKNPTPVAFTPLSRPTFRYHISEILRRGLETPDGRVISLGTTTMTKDAWEVYSPGEERVVMCGRLGLISGSGRP
jgi:hypothetical protein